MKLSTRAQASNDPAVIPPGAPRSSRNQAIELLRIVAAFGIVAYHASVPGKNVAHSGLVIFLVLSPLLDVEHNWTRVRPVGALAKTLLVPWAVWFVFYALVNVARHVPVIPGNGGIVAGILSGSNPHLWFLPFIFGVLLLIGVIKRFVSPEVAYAGSLAIATILIVSLGSWEAGAVSTGYPFAQWLLAVPAIFAGIAIGLSGRIRHGPAATIIALGLALILLAMHDLHGISVRYALGLGLVLVAVRFGNRLIPFGWNVESVSRCMLGVYLMHIFWLLVAARLTHRMDYAAVVFAFCVSLAIVWLARRYVPASRLFL